MRAHEHGRVVVALGALALAGALATSCASPRDALGPSESACYQAIPVAVRAAPADARFAGVRYLSLTRFDHALVGSRPALASAMRLPFARGQSACVVAYRGHFSAVLDDHTLGPSHGDYLLVVVSLRPERELGAIVVTRAPFRLARLLPTSH